jgi:hypothetical protein
MVVKHYGKVVSSEIISTMLSLLSADQLLVIERSMPPSHVKKFGNERSLVTMVEKLPEAKHMPTWSLLAREWNTAVASAPPNPETAPELFRDRTDKSEEALAFAFRVYQPWLYGPMTDATLRSLDPDLHIRIRKDWAWANSRRPFVSTSYLKTLRKFAKEHGHGDHDPSSP